MRPLMLLILMYPLLELWLLIEVASIIGGVAVLGLILVSGLLGLAVLRQAGWQTLRRARTAISPATEVTDGMLLGGAGLLLFLPGLIGDALGLLMLLPGARRGLARRLLGRLIVVGRGGAGPNTGRSSSRPEPDVIDGEFSRVPPAGDPIDDKPVSGNRADKTLD